MWLAKETWYTWSQVPVHPACVGAGPGGVCPPIRGRGARGTRQCQVSYPANIYLAYLEYMAYLAYLEYSEPKNKGGRLV